jgi:hypothetical protein
MRIRRLSTTGLGVLSASLGLAAGPAAALTIDAFTSPQTTTVISPFSSATTTATGAGILGGEREMTVNRLSGVAVTMTSAVGSLGHGQIAGSLGTGEVIWDGVDGGAPFDPLGLGGVDFTDGGLSAAVAISLLFDNLPATLTLTAYTDAGNASSVTAVLPGGIPPGPVLVLTIPFSDFAPFAGTGADFTSIGALQMEIDGTSSSGLNLALGPVETVPIPEPGTFFLLGLGLVGLAGYRRRRFGLVPPAVPPIPRQPRESPAIAAPV